MNGVVEIVPDVAAAFAELMASEMRALAARAAGGDPGGSDDADGGGDPQDGRLRVALSGGPTARRCYQRLAAVPDLPWHLTEIFWGDERCVPPNHPDSNAKLAHETLLDHVGPLAAVHPMSCAVGAEDYEEVLRRAGRLDIAHLGLGPDGHTASLFPGSDALQLPRDRLAVVTRDPSERNPHDRMTLTLAALEAVGLSVFTVSGAEKRDAFARVQAGEDLPGGRVASGRVVWLVDPAAAGAA